MGVSVASIGEGLTSRGRAVLVAASILFGLLAVVSEANVGTVIILASFLLVFIYLSKVSFDFKINAARKLRAERIFSRPIVEGRPLKVTIRIENPTMVPLEIAEIFDPYPNMFRLHRGSNTGMAYIPANGFFEISYEVIPTLGKHEFGNPRLVIRDPAGLFSREIELRVNNLVEVQPRYEMIQRRGLLVVPTLKPGGVSSIRRRGMGMQFMDIREYVPGDEYRRIEWKATARTGKLMVKEFEQESSLEVMLILDTRDTMSYGVLGQTKLEYAVRGAATIAGYLLRRGDFVGLAYASMDGIRIVKPRRGPAHFRLLMQTLAQITWPIPGIMGLAPLHVVVRQAASRATRRGKNLYIVFTDLEMSPEELPQYVNLFTRLRGMRSEVVVISPYTPLFEVKGMTGMSAVIYRLYASRSIKEREKIVRTLLRHGIPLVNVGPEDLVSTTLLRIEAIRQRLS